MKTAAREPCSIWIWQRKGITKETVSYNVLEDETAMPYRNRKYVKNRIRTKRTIPMQRIREVGMVLLFFLLLPYVAATLSGQVGSGTGIAEQEKLFLLLEDENGAERIPLNTFLTGALAASMDTQMEEETLKAQAVLLRTAVWEAYGRREDKGSDSVPVKELSQEYYSVYELKKSWLDEFEEKYGKLKRIVEETDGVIMTYQGIPVKTPYFYVSAGKTRNGSEVYAQGEYPYLLSVESEQDMFCMDYGSSVLYSNRLFFQKAAALFQQETEEMEELTQLDIQRDSVGYVSAIKWRDTVIPGEVFREAFDLRSSYFTLEQKPEGICITTSGVGHGLGFSQYGANEMAKTGKLCDDLLKYYFHDIEIENY